MGGFPCETEGCVAHLVRRENGEGKGSDNDQAVQLVHVTKAETVLGRLKSADVVVRTAERNLMSRRHARLVAERGASGEDPLVVWRIEDTNSMNGIAVNGVRTPGERLSSGDWIAFGRYLDVEAGVKLKEACHLITFTFYHRPLELPGDGWLLERLGLSTSPPPLLLDEGAVASQDSGVLFVPEDGGAVVPAAVLPVREESASPVLLGDDRPSLDGLVMSGWKLSATPGDTHSATPATALTASMASSGGRAASPSLRRLVDREEAALEVSSASEKTEMRSKARTNMRKQALAFLKGL
ncbi:uncharacterized protein AMSG_06717 [Thecamonas trahens ATCC 50062]|uniref:FHA domain-containing protein n=1 Tax=Thecamonas trahens ATCC 50062 TaxID=461836 RepID=A0A0L0DEU5_THETB|nr:hypothetical protein AMSG_06717 [Thecamonas trahens ATCC 50062]KNC50814.1 hypothetical protein AMSG_06717 [Thecamonas trahens ATCC 50062]|eukprot:XP_013756769.1 hypothetical protein AMSG_06717 [Thecamonas trahens ATCC 50062]